MRVKVYWVDDSPSGRVGLMPRPRGGDWLADEVRSLRDSGVDVVVSMLELEEAEELDLAGERSCCEAEAISFLSFPVRDRGVPPPGRDTVSFIRKLAGLLAAKKNVVIHCRQGVGRSALLAASVLAARGVPARIAFERIAEARGCPVPDTEGQRDWVFRFAATEATADRVC